MPSAVAKWILAAGRGKPDLHCVVRLLEEFTAGQLEFPS